MLFLGTARVLLRPGNTFLPAGNPETAKFVNGWRLDKRRLLFNRLEAACGGKALA